MDEGRVLFITLSRRTAIRHPAAEAYISGLRLFNVSETLQIRHPWPKIPHVGLVLSLNKNPSTLTSEVIQYTDSSLQLVLGSPTDGSPS